MHFHTSSKFSKFSGTDDRTQLLAQINQGRKINDVEITSYKMIKEEPLQELLLTIYPLKGRYHINQERGWRINIKELILILRNQVWSRLINNIDKGKLQFSFRNNATSCFPQTPAMNSHVNSSHNLAALFLPFPPKVLACHWINFCSPPNLKNPSSSVVAFQSSMVVCNS